MRIVELKIIDGPTIEDAFEGESVQYEKVDRGFETIGIINLLKPQKND